MFKIRDLKKESGKKNDNSFYSEREIADSPLFTENSKDEIKNEAEITISNGTAADSEDTMRDELPEGSEDELYESATSESSDFIYENMKPEIINRSQETAVVKMEEDNWSFLASLLPAEILNKDSMDEKLDVKLENKWDDSVCLEDTYPSFHKNIFEKDPIQKLATALSSISRSPIFEKDSIRNLEKQSSLSSIPVSRSIIFEKDPIKSLEKPASLSAITRSSKSKSSEKSPKKVDNGLNPLIYNDNDECTATYLGAQPFRPPSPATSDFFFSPPNFGLTVVDVAELLLHRGAKNIKNELFNEAFNNYNAAYKLLFEIKRQNDDDDDEKMKVIRNIISNDKLNKAKLISSQLQGLTQKILLDNIEKLYNLLNVEVCREEGDLFFAMKGYHEAIAKYDEALIIIPMHVGCLSNRAACKLASEDFLGCVQDSTTAFHFLDVQIAPMDAFFENNGIDLLTCVVPLIGTIKRLELTVKTVIRRGAAYVRLDQLQKAVVDYRTAASLDPKNTILQNDLKMLISHRDDQIRLFTKRS